MPEIGDIVKGSEIGKSAKNHWFKYTACPSCDTPRYIDMSEKSPTPIDSRLCKKCFIKTQGREFKIGRTQYD